MLTALESEDNVPAADASADCRNVYQIAGKAFDLIDKHRTPPNPLTYALWYTYASGSDPLLVERVDELIASKGSLSPYDVEAIHWELVATGSDNSNAFHIGDAIEKEIESVLGIIQQGVTSSDNYHASLSETGNRLTNSVSGEDLASLVSNLVEENRRMAETTRELSEGLNDSQKQLETLHKELEEVQNQSMRDPLTAIPNRRAFDQRLEQEVDQAFKAGDKLCLAMADIDHFKQVNDTFGHQVGDSVLQMFASIMSKNTKDQDMVARIGGEEFGLILPETDIFAAHNILVRIKSKLKEAKLTLDDGKTVVTSITASFGISKLEPGMTARDLIEQADKYLYEAKKAGRDKIKAKGF